MRSVQDRAPDASILPVGYPRLAPDVGTCAALARVDQPALDDANYLLGAINDEIRSTARDTGVGFVDVAGLSTGHQLCSNDPWVEGHPGDQKRPYDYHPVAAEQRAVPEAVAAPVKTR